MSSQLEKAWIERFIESGDAQASVREIYPDCGAKSTEPEQAVRIRASQLKKNLALEIDKRLRETLASDSVTMLTIIKGIATTAKSEETKLKAAKDWLDRGGYKPADEIITKESPTDPKLLEEQWQAELTKAVRAMTPEEIDARKGIEH